MKWYIGIKTEIEAVDELESIFVMLGLIIFKPPNLIEEENFCITSSEFDHCQNKEVAWEGAKKY